MGCLREGKYREEFRLDWSTYATENTLPQYSQVLQIHNKHIAHYMIAKYSKATCYSHSSSFVADRDLEVEPVESCLLP